jgi:hypothetical protein
MAIGMKLAAVVAVAADQSHRKIQINIIITSTTTIITILTVEKNPLVIVLMLYCHRNPGKCLVEREAFRVYVATIFLHKIENITEKQNSIEIMYQAVP